MQPTCNHRFEPGLIATIKGQENERFLNCLTGKAFGTLNRCFSSKKTR
jgi:hypothetical protein